MQTSRYKSLVLALQILATSLGACRTSTDEAPAQRVALPTAAAPEPSAAPEVAAPEAAPSLLRLTISPEEPTRGMTLTAQAQTSEAALLRYRWYVNGEEQLGELSDTFEADLPRGSRVQAKAAVVHAGEEGPLVGSAVVVIRNAPPVLTSAVSPGAAMDGFQFTASDPDEDPITWRIEGAPPDLTISPAGVLRLRQGSKPTPGRWEVKVIGEDGHGGFVTARFELGTQSAAPAAP